MLILQRYLLRQGLAASLLSLTVFLGVVSALFLAELLGDASKGQVPGGSVLLFLVLRLPEAVMLVGPLALLTGLLLTLGRLQEESELVVSRAAGLSFRRAMTPVFVLSALWSVMMLVTAGWLSPLAVERTSSLLADAARNAAVAGLRPGQFDRINQGRTTVYVGSMGRNGQVLRDVFIQHLEDGTAQVLTAREGGLWDGDSDDGRYLLLTDGYHLQHEMSLADGKVRTMRFARNELRLPAPDTDQAETEATFRLPELWPAQSAGERREWHWRLAAPVAALLLGLLALPLSSRGPRQGRFGSVVMALVLYLLYSNGVHAGLIVMEQQGALRGPGLWPVHAALALLVATLMLRQWRTW